LFDNKEKVSFTGIKMRAQLDKIHPLFSCIIDPDSCLQNDSS